MSKKKAENNVIKYPKSYHFSIGMVIIGVMFIYIVYHMYTFITTDIITVYEVSQGSISSNLEYNALAIRDETLHTSEYSGNIIYLAENFGRVGMKSKLYAIDESGSLITNMTATSISDADIDKNALSELQSNISTYITSYQDINFNKIYSFKNELETQIDQLYNLSAMNSMGDQVNAAINEGTFHIEYCKSPGLIVYSTDGLEDLTLENFSDSNFETANVSITNLKSQQSVIHGQPIYKIINSNNWNLVCQINADLYNRLAEKNYIEIEFLEDETTTWTSINLEQRGSNYYLILNLDDSVNRFASQRFVQIKLLDKDISGLKIPNSSIVKKQFYTIPKSYFFQGANSSDMGLLVMESSTTNTFVSPIIYYETDDYYYIDNEQIKDGDILIKPSSSDKYIVGSDLAELEGVYNVNKGYTVFKQIVILFQNEDYSIIRSGTQYGVSMYDHIVLQGDSVEENSIIN